jgi:hypothetical protein
MQRISDIKQRREDRFWENRMKLAKVQKQVDVEREVLTHGNLLADKQKKEELQERIRERENARSQQKQEQRQRNRGKMVVEEEL